MSKDEQDIAELDSHIEGQKRLLFTETRMKAGTLQDNRDD